MVLHMRSKLLEAARMSIYEEAKTKSQENPNAAKISSIVTGTLPREYTRCSFLASVKSVLDLNLVHVIPYLDVHLETKQSKRGLFVEN